MTCWYNEPKEGYAKIGALIDATEVNSRLDFSEAAFKLDEKDKSIHCYIFATSLTDVKKSGESKWTFEPQPIYFQIRNEAYEKSQGRDKPPAKVEPTAFSKWLYKELLQNIEDSNLDNGCFLASGFIQFCEGINSQTAKMVLEGKDSKGKDLTDEMISFFASQCFEFAPILPEDVKNLKLDALPDLAPKGGSKGGYGGARGQTERERLNDRFNFAKTICGLQENATLEDLASYCTQNDAATALLQMLIK